MVAWKKRGHPNKKALINPFRPIAPTTHLPVIQSKPYLKILDLMFKNNDDKTSSLLSEGETKASMNPIKLIAERPASLNQRTQAGVIRNFQMTNP